MGSPYYTQPFCLRSQVLSYIGFTGLLYHLGGDFEILYLHAKRFSGAYLPAEFDLVYRGQEEEGVPPKKAELAQACAACLGHGFYEYNPRHHRVSGKMPLKEECILAEDMACDDPVRICRKDGIHKKKRFSMGQKGFNIIGVPCWGFYDFYVHMRLLYSLRWLWEKGRRGSKVPPNRLEA